jgi:hypothetical protein
MKPPLVKTTATDPVSAREGVLKPANPNIPNSAAIAIFLLVLLIKSPPRNATRRAIVER